MPTRVDYHQIYQEGQPPLLTEYKTKEEAETEAKRLDVETGKKHEVWSADRWAVLEEEEKATATMYLLTREDCNGEYGTVAHRSLHGSIDGAKAVQARLVDPIDLKGEDAQNEWHPYEYEKDVLQFRTGNWGYVVWEIRPLKVCQ